MHLQGWAVRSRCRVVEPLHNVGGNWRAMGRKCQQPLGGPASHAKVPKTTCGGSPNFFGLVAHCRIFVNWLSTIWDRLFGARLSLLLVHLLGEVRHLRSRLLESNVNSLPFCGILFFPSPSFYWMSNVQTLYATMLGAKCLRLAVDCP